MAASIPYQRSFSSFVPLNPTQALIAASSNSYSSSSIPVEVSVA